MSKDDAACHIWTIIMFKVITLLVSCYGQIIVAMIWNNINYKILISINTYDVKNWQDWRHSVDIQICTNLIIVSWFFFSASLSLSSYLFIRAQAKMNMLTRDNIFSSYRSAFQIFYLQVTSKWGVFETVTHKLQKFSGKGNDKEVLKSITNNVIYVRPQTINRWNNFLSLSDKLNKNCGLLS
jgi:hypothetical protein